MLSTDDDKLSRHATQTWIFNIVKGAVEGINHDHPDWGLTGYRAYSIRKRIAGCLKDALDKRIRKLCARELHRIKKAISTGSEDGE